MAEAQSRRTRTLKYGTNVIVGSILFLVILVVANFIANRSQARVDLTRDKDFTLSEATKGLLTSLKDLVTVTVYATQHDTPPDWTEQREQLRSLLYEYRVRSRGKVNYVFKDPSADPKVATEAEQAQVQQQPMQHIGSQELSL